MEDTYQHQLDLYYLAKHTRDKAARNACLSVLANTSRDYEGGQIVPKQVPRSVLMAIQMRLGDGNYTPEDPLEGAQRGDYR